MANRTEHAGVLRNFTFNKDGTEYRVFETTTKRSQDLFRFELWKPEAETPYVVSFQTDNGSQGACSCPAGKFHRNHGECKHIKMCRMEFMSGSQARRPASRTQNATPKAPKALPPTFEPETVTVAERAQLSRGLQASLPGLDQKAALKNEIKELRATYAQKRDLRDSLDKEMDLLARQGKLLNERLAKI